jgi:hypothetical protein
VTDAEQRKEVNDACPRENAGGVISWEFGFSPSAKESPLT